MGISSLSEDQRDTLQLYAERIFTYFDEDNSGYIDSNEFTAALLSLMGADAVDRLLMALKVYGLKEDGVIDPYDMQHFLEGLLHIFMATHPEAFSMSKSVLENTIFKFAFDATVECFLHADRDNDGLISAPEFQEWYYSEESETPEWMKLFDLIL